MRQLPLGVTGRDVVTGLSGTISGKTSALTGCDQYFLCPRGLDRDGQPRTGMWVDVSRVKADNKQVVEPKTPIGPRFALGSSVQDPITGFVGTVTSEAIFVDGRIEYALTPRVTDPDKLPTGVWFANMHLKSQGNDIVQLIEDASEPERNVQVSTARQTGCDVPHPMGVRCDPAPPAP